MALSQFDRRAISNGWPFEATTVELDPEQRIALAAEQLGGQMLLGQRRFDVGRPSGRAATRYAGVVPAGHYLG